MGLWAECLKGAYALVNVAGRTVDCVKTPEHCDQILRSRVESTLVLGEALKQCQNPPKIWVQMSTAHIVGDPPKLLCDEFSPHGYGIAPFVGQKWEEAFAKSCPVNVRQVVLRTSFVMGKSGGAMPVLSKIVKLGLGGTISHGEQGMSWIHAEDMNRLFERSIENSFMQGVYIATAPHPVSNKIFMKALRNAHKMPFGLPAASWMIRLAAPFLKTDPELVLYGRYCVSKRLREEGFEFKYPKIEAAFLNLYS